MYLAIFLQIVCFQSDDIQRLVQEVDEIMGQSCSIPVDEKVAPTISNCSNLLSIETRNLNPSNELKKIFGSRTVQADQR